MFCFLTTDFIFSFSITYNHVESVICVVCSFHYVPCFKKFQVLHKLQQYLPLLENFVSQVDMIDYNLRIVQWTSDLKIRWSSALSSSSLFHLRGPKFFQIDNLRFEVGMTLSLYGAVLRQRASEVISEGGY